MPRSALSIDDLVEEVELLLPHNPPERIAQRLDMSTAALARRLDNHGHHTLSRPFHAAYARERHARKDAQ